MKTITIPIVNSIKSDIFDTTETTLDYVKSQLYCLLLTPIGSRVMEPSFGTSVYNILFEQNNINKEYLLKNEILEKASVFVPLCVIKNITFTQNENLGELELTFALKDAPSVTDSLMLTLSI